MTSQPATNIARTSGACIALLDMGPKGSVSSNKTRMVMHAVKDAISQFLRYRGSLRVSQVHEPKTNHVQSHITLSRALVLKSLDLITLINHITVL